MTNLPRFSVAAVIATAFRDETLWKTLVALDQQTRRIDRAIIVDSAPAPGIEPAVNRWRESLRFPILYQRSPIASAAAQRNQGAAMADEDLLLFIDDDLYPDPDCIEKMVTPFEQDNTGQLGGMGVLLKNELACPPRPRAKRWFDFLADEVLPDYGGHVIGPAVNFYVSPTTDGRIVDVMWLNAGCTIYRRTAFAEERFGERFIGYSFMEDVDLSLRVARKWKLRVHTGAMAFHDSQPSQFKTPFRKARMSIENRYYVMTETMKKTSLLHHWRFLLLIVVSWFYAGFRIRSIDSLKQWFLAGMGYAVGLTQICPLVLSRLIRNQLPTKPSLNFTE